MQSLALLSSSMNLDYSRDGGVLTGTSTGTVTTSGGKLVLTAAGTKRVDWSVFRNAPITHQTDVEIWVTPNYSGAPADYQTFFYKGNTIDSDGGRFHISHQGDNGLYLQSVAAVSGQSVQFRLPNWNPVAGTEYIIRATSNWTTGVHQIFVNGILVATGAVTTGTQFHGALMMRVGSDWSGLNVANFSCRYLQIRDSVQYTASYTTAVPTVPTASSDPGIANVKTGTTYGFGGSSLTGTYDGSDRWTDPGFANVLSGVQYKANSTTNNRTGTLIAGVPEVPLTSTGLFPDIERLVVKATNRVLGTTISYTRFGFTAVNIRGTFNNEWVDIQGTTLLKPVLRTDLAQLAGAAGNQDICTINSVNYRVLEVRKDAFGGAILILQKV